ncbi:hypothetical protein [Agreia sp. VKM Ac-1783]|uniref:hypothetical protein n=1 Tax=Agreia sp. VKM Ac-1783 TaxID=1938889 RepID=UPI000A2AAC90|nr:hypothetical protein [Agreia sp. VKM Ac-1783]SMQ73463.1 hypothetical protein SAMN06295943_2886 [Agreia sp. VKM Ac-1783]
MPQISHGGITINPFLLTYSWDEEMNNIRHKIIGRSDDDITFKPASLRAGTLGVLCMDEAEALAVRALHRDPGTFVLVDDEVTSASMTYVPVGTMRVGIDPETLTRWLLAIEFQEVPA